MILTYKIKHSFDLKELLDKARLVAELSIKNRDKLSSKYVAHIGLKSAISNQILRKYGKNKRCKSVSKVNIIVPGQGIKTKDKTLILKPLKLTLDISYIPSFIKVNQVELSASHAYVSVEIFEPQPYKPQIICGLDRNATQHVAVLANLSNGKILKLGKSCLHIRNKYSNIRKEAQNKGEYRFITKKLKKRESNITKDLNHKIALKIVQYCFENKAALILEDLKGIREQKKSKGKKFNKMLHSWSFYQLEQFILYKAKLYGVPVYYVNPAYTSKSCSECGHLGIRNGKSFNCKQCGHVDHADANAAFSIGQKHLFGRSLIDRDISDGITGNTDRGNEICMHS